MIRLGTLAGYPFEGPRLLAGWIAPARAAVFAILYRPDSERHPDRYAVIFIGASDDLSAERLPFSHPQAPCWIARAGSRFAVSIATYEIPGGQRKHREEIAAELIAIYRPGCNVGQFDRAWREEWIGGYRAPTTGPLTTGRDPGRSPQTPPAPAG